MRNFQLIFLLFVISLFTKSCFYSKKFSLDKKYTAPATINDLDVHKRNSLEWWYFASHMNDSTGKEYGVMLTLFKRNFFINKTGYMVNCIITNNKDTIAQKWVKFYTNKKSFFNSNADIIKINNRQINFAISKLKEDSFNVNLISKDNKLPSISFTHSIKKPIVKQTPTGYMQYGNTGNAGYISYTNTITDGNIILGNKKINLTGKTWIDKQWNCMSIVKPATSWIWTGIQFDNREECMVFNFYNNKLKENNIQVTYIDSMRKANYFIINKENWLETSLTKSSTNKTYPTTITFKIVELNKTITITSPSYDHEIDTKFLGKSKMTYWESKCKAVMLSNNDTIKGAAFLEITNIQNRK